MARLHVLGSAAHLPGLARATTAHLLETRRCLVLFEAGSGVSRLADPLLQEVLGRSRRLIVLLSRFRQDHLAGLAWLPHHAAHLEVAIVTPPGGASGEGLAAGLARWLGEPFVPGGYEAWSQRFAKGVRLYEAAPKMRKVLGETVTALAGESEGDPVAYRVRDVVHALAPRTPGLIAFAERASMVVRGFEGPQQTTAMRALAREAAAEARDAKVSDLLLAHLHPTEEASQHDALTFEAGGIFPRTALAADMSLFKLTGVADEEEEASEGESGAAAPEGDAEDAPKAAEPDGGDPEASGNLAPSTESPAP